MGSKADTTGPLAAGLLEHLANARDALVQRYLDSLRATLFTNRAEVRPSLLARIAAAEADALLAYLTAPDQARARLRGAQLCELGLSERAMLDLSQTTRGYLLAHVEPHQLTEAISGADNYQSALIEGFIQTREKVILSEQERIRSALQRTLARYTVQMELAAGVAAATTSILHPEELFVAAVDLIQQRFDLAYAGLFMLDAQGQYAELRAGSGEAGQKLIEAGYRLDVAGDSLVAECIREREARAALGLDARSAQAQPAFLKQAQSEAAIPLIVRHQVIGAISVHHQRVAAFTEQDVTILRVLANQLANAIENARLFAELRQSEERYRTILENIEDGYYETDLDGRVTFANESTCTILGFPRAEIEGRPYWSFSEAEQGQLIAATFSQVRQSGEAAKGVEFSITRKDAQSRFVETSIALLRDSDGAPAGFQGVIRDTTRRKQADQLLIERKALERSNRELEQFAYVASHDLQEPLRKIQTFGDRLQLRYEAALGSEGRDYLERMLNAAERMQSLINGLLMLSRVATKAQPFAAVDMATVAREVIFDLEARIEACGGLVEVRPMELVEADPLQMRQLLQNLIGNALKFHRPGVPPVIQVFGRPGHSRLTGGGLSRENQYQIVVQDNGIGFDTKHAERIFQPFQRLHGRNSYEGTGIGLAICQRIAERHGGRITVQSVPGVGSTFVVTLPNRQAQAREGA